MQAAAGAHAVSARRRRRRDRRRMLGDVGLTTCPLPGSTFEIIDGVGHFLHLEQPEVIAARILDWLG